MSFYLRMQPAIFLDRDGTLNFDYGWIASPSKIELLPGAADAVRSINEAAYLALLVTNQPVVARGECSAAEVDAIHDRLRSLLAQAGARLDGIYYCPHHPDFAAPCGCRKPAPGLLEAAVRDHQIDVNRSWMVGDSERDLGAAVAFGIRAALVASNQEVFKESIISVPTFRANSVLEAVQRILSAC